MTADGSTVPSPSTLVVIRDASAWDLFVGRRQPKARMEPAGRGVAVDVLRSPRKPLDPAKDSGSHEDKNPDQGEVRALDALRDAFENDSANTGVPFERSQLRAFEAPVGVRGVTEAIARLFAVRVQFVSTGDVDPRLNFDGVAVATQPGTI